jgi:hypothetical protein
LDPRAKTTGDWIKLQNELQRLYSSPNVSNYNYQVKEYEVCMAEKPEKHHKKDLDADGWVKIKVILEEQAGID